MQEQRRYPRKSPNYLVDVFDVVTGESMGKLGNLSEDGLLLIAPEPVAEGSLFQLRFALRELSEGEAKEIQFNVGATCLWSQESASGSFWLGFQIIDISEQQQEGLSQALNLM